MTGIETLRPEAMAAVPVAAPQLAEPPQAAPTTPAAFSGRWEEEDRPSDLLAYALAAEADEATAAAVPEAAVVERHRRHAERALHDHAFRLLHNRIEEIRREAV